MSARTPPSLGDTMVGVGVALAGALVVGLALSSFGKAPDFNTRVTTLEADTVRAQGLLAGSGKDAPAPPDALCRQPSAEAARRLHDSLAASAARVGVPTDLLDVRPEGRGDPNAPEPLRIRINGTGSYEGVIGLVAEMARARPQVFVDSLDLTPKTSNVSLSFSGRAFCAG